MTYDELKNIAKNIKTDNFKITDIGDCFVINCQKNFSGDKYFIHDDGSILLVVDSSKPNMSSSIWLRQDMDFGKILKLVEFLQ